MEIIDLVLEKKRLELEKKKLTIEREKLSEYMQSRNLKPLGWKVIFESFIEEIIMLNFIKMNGLDVIIKMDQEMKKKRIGDQDEKI